MGLTAFNAARRKAQAKAVSSLPKKENFTEPKTDEKPVEKSHFGVDKLKKENK